MIWGALFVMKGVSFFLGVKKLIWWDVALAKK